jgi:predicted dehydrogenase
MIDDVDIVDICMSLKYHLDNMRLAVKRGKHVICVRPLGRNWWAVELNRDIIDLVEQKNLQFVMHTQSIWNPRVAIERDLISEGAIGTVERVRLLQQCLDPKHTVELLMLRDPLHASGGALTDIGPHPFASMWYWLGEGWTPVTVDAKRLEATVPVRTMGESPAPRCHLSRFQFFDYEARENEGPLTFPNVLFAY